MVGYLVHISKEDSGPLVHTDAAIHRALLLQGKLKVEELTKDLRLCPDCVAFRLIPILEHMLSDIPQFAFAHSLRFGAMTKDAVQGFAVASHGLSFQDEPLNIVNRLRLVGPLFNLLPGASLAERFNR